MRTHPERRRAVAAATAAASFLLVHLQPAAAQSCGQQVWTQRNAFSFTPDLPSPRSYHAMAFDLAHGYTVLFGGNALTGRSNDTWVFGGPGVGSWTHLTPATSPPVRDQFAMAYDSLRQRVVVFGGLGPSVLSDTWEWDGVNWSEAAVAPPTDGRYGHAMVFDTVRECIVLFGGANTNGFQSEVWEWDGASWTLRPTSGGPSARTNMAFAYDSFNSCAVLFGGFNPTSGSGGLGDTWLLNSATGTWTQVAMGGPAPVARQLSAMVYDSGRHRAVLFGGTSTGVSAQADTWEWNGAAWAQQAVGQTSPPGRNGHAMAYDSIHSRTIVHNGNGSFNDTWEWSALALPGFARQPNAQVVGVGRPAQLSVVATGTGTLSYQWRRYGFPVVNGGPIGGATTATLTISPAAASDTGDYDVVVSNTCGSVTSAVAVLNVTCTPQTIVYDVPSTLLSFAAGAPGYSPVDIGGHAAGTITVRIDPACGSGSSQAQVTAVDLHLVEDPTIAMGTAGSATLTGTHLVVNGTEGTLPSPQPIAAGSFSQTGVVPVLHGTLAYSIFGLTGNRDMTTLHPATLAFGGTLAGPGGAPGLAAAFNVSAPVGGASDPTISASGTLPAVPRVCQVDYDHNGVVQPADISLFVQVWFSSLNVGNLVGDLDGNGVVQPADVSLFVQRWFNALVTGAC